jgi:tetratricopeptide (TPR) repeat protein
MKQFLILFSLTMTIVCCTQRQQDNEKLAVVEKAIANDPYSAFEVLDSMTKNDLKTARDTALYNLFYVEALHKMDLYTFNDSMIERSEQYFSKSNEKHYLLLTYLHHGISYYDNRDFLKAIKYLKRSEQMAEDNQEDNMKYEIYTRIAKTNNDANCKEIALKYYKMALTHCDTTTNKDDHAHCLNDIAAIYENMEQTDSFKVYIRQCIRMRNGIKNEADVKTNIGNYYLKTGHKDKAKKYLENALRTNYEYETAKIIGDMYASEDNMSKAVEYYYQSVESRIPEIRIYSYHKLIDFYSKNGDDKRALDLSERLNNEYRHYQAINASEIAKYQADWDEQIARDKMHHHTMILACTIALLLVVITTFIYLHHLRMRRYKNVITRYITDLEQYKKTKNELNALRCEQQQNDALITKKMFEIQTLQQKLSEYQDDKQSSSNWNLEDSLMNAEIVYHLHNQASRGKAAADNDWIELHEVVSEGLPYFISSINSKSDLTNKEINICLLTRLRFIPSEIASLTASSPQSVTNARVKLLNKIFGIKGGAKTFDERIWNLPRPINDL